jgi:hypothetical protein
MICKRVLQALEPGESSVSRVVEKIVENNPVLKECLASGLANYSRVARAIKRFVDEELGGEASIESIKVALIRLARRLSPMNVSNIERILRETSIEVKTKVSVLTYDSSALREIVRIAGSLQGTRFLSIVTGITSITVMVGDEQSKTFLNIGSKPLFQQSGLTAILLVSPVENIYTPGLIAYVTTILAQSNINIIQITSSYSETIIVISPEDTMKAFSILSEAIARARGKGAGEIPSSKGVG